MNRARFAVVLISIFSGMSCTVAGGADVPDKVQLIGLPPTNLPVATEWSGLIQWPPLETIQSCVVTDRVFFSTNVLNEQSVLEDPARQPVLRAKLEACDWVCNVLRSEWCQGYDWAKGNSWAVRMGSPIRSMMMDRYEIGGTAIQAMQSRSRMCIVIRPSAELTKGMESKDLPKFVLRTFFTRGEDMVRLPSKEVKLEQPPMRAAIGEPGNFSVEAEHSWWGWSAWYTDGKAVAVLLRKCIPSTGPGNDDSWF